MSERELTAALRRIVAEVAELDDDAVITESANLRDDLGINSMRGLEIILLVEEELGIAVSEAALYQIETFGDVVAATRAQAGPGPPAPTP